MHKMLTLIDNVLDNEHHSKNLHVKFSFDRQLGGAFEECILKCKPLTHIFISFQHQIHSWVNLSDISNHMVDSMPIIVKFCVNLAEFYYLNLSQSQELVISLLDVFV